MLILLVDDHPLILEGLLRTVGAEFPGAILHTATSPSETLSAVAGVFFEIVVLDLSMSGRGGFELLRDVKQQSPASRVLVHTMSPEEQFGVPALRAGADGYVTKDRPVSDLLAAIRQLKSGRKYVSPTLTDRLADFVSASDPDEMYSRLSDREHQVLRLIAAGRTPSQMAEEMSLSIKTVSTYRARLMEKLKVRTTADIVKFAVARKLH